MSSKRMLWLGVAAWAAVLGGCTCSGSNNNNQPPGSGGGNTIGFFLPNRPGGTIVSNRVPSLAVDGAGGIHAVYAADGVDATGRRPAYYVYCASNCTDASHFAGVAISDGLGTAQLALDPAGHPRLLLAVGPNTNNVVTYEYWVCDSGCTNGSNWNGVVVAAGPASFYPSPVQKNQFAFALDPQGRPRLLYYANDFGNSGPAGDLYAYCDANCLDDTSWSLTRLSYDHWKNMGLAFQPNGLPIISFTTKRGAPDYQPVLAYVECDQTDCQGATPGVDLLVTTTAGANSDAAFALRADSAGHPRLLVYPGTGTGGTIPPNRLYYLACDGACTDLKSWSVLDLGAPDKSGEGGVDLALDKQNRPRIAYRLPAPTDEMAVATCDANCKEATQSWKGVTVPATAAAERELGLPPRQGCPDCSPPIPPCPSAFYDSGYWPSVAVDSAGKASVAFQIDLKSGGGKCTAGSLAEFSRIAPSVAP